MIKIIEPPRKTPKLRQADLYNISQGLELNQQQALEWLGKKAARQQVTWPSGAVALTIS